MSVENDRIGLRNRKMDSAMTPTIRVEIYNQTYNIRSDGDSEYIGELAEFVDNRMREISSGTLTVDSLKVAILAALHIADELHRLQKTHEQADSQLATRSSECSEMLDRILKARPNSANKSADQADIAFS
jgi:cell division protein ZapA